MTTQTKAQLLADELENTPFESTRYEAAKELRRLDKIEAEWATLSQDDGKAQREIERLEAANAELLESLIDLVALYPLDSTDAIITSARAAIAKHGGQS